VITLEKFTPRLSHPNLKEFQMATASVIDLTPSRKSQPITHYAYYGETYGTAELLNGSGYLFRKDGERKARLVSYKDPALVLLGLMALADAQREADEAAGGLAALVCGYGKGR
jgi:hypothetical protein